MSDTKDHILDVAERLFSEQGIAATSLRGIMSQAGVNPAAIHYHFGGKQELVEAVVNRRITPLNEERLKLLDAIEARGEPFDPEEILEAFFAPALHLSDHPERGGGVFMRLLGRLYNEAGEDAENLLKQQFGELLSRFATALKKSVPTLSLKKFAWRFHFLTGSLAYAMCDRTLVEMVSGGKADPSHTGETVAELVEFTLAGLTASLPEGKPRKIGR